MTTVSTMSLAVIARVNCNALSLAPGNELPASLIATPVVATAEPVSGLTTPYPRIRHSAFGNRSTEPIQSSPPNQLR
ncbi:MAG: hypothetical protein WBG92_09280, partial [Thiohalocapsa sp.]